MTGPLMSLRAAILARVGGDAALAALMGGVVRLYDEPPRGAHPVYAVFGPAEARDDAVDGAQRCVHSLALIVYGRPGSARSALDAAERMGALLTEAPPTPGGHALILLRAQAIQAARDERTGETRATLTLQAVTEVAAPPVPLP